MTTPAAAPTIHPVVVVDTSVWISLIHRADANHSAALSWVGQHVQQGGSLLAPTILVIETASGLVRATNRAPVAQRAVHDLTTRSFLRLVPMDQPLVDESVRLAVSCRLRGADAIFVALAWREGVPLVTFDQEQLTRSAGIIAVLRP